METLDWWKSGGGGGSRIFVVEEFPSTETFTKTASVPACET